MGRWITFFGDSVMLAAPDTRLSFTRTALLRPREIPSSVRSPHASAVQGIPTEKT